MVSYSTDAFRPTISVSHDEERVNGAGIGDKRDRAPRHWLNALVGPGESPTKHRLHMDVPQQVLDGRGIPRALRLFQVI